VRPAILASDACGAAYERDARRPEERKEAAANDHQEIEMSQIVVISRGLSQRHGRKLGCLAARAIREEKNLEALVAEILETDHK
jgi:hypothetical protein